MCDDSLATSRRQMLKLAALFGAGASLPLPKTFEARAAAEPNPPLRIGYLPITDATPLLVAHARGLFQAEGLEVEAPHMFRSWAQLVEAFIAGQVNVVHLLSPMTVWSRFGGHVPAKVVQVADIPRTKSGKIVELAVRNIVHGLEVRNLEALANPEVLEQFRDRDELKT